MRRVIDIALSNRSFAFDEEAGMRLTGYLEAFREALKGEIQVSEIMEDIEERIAELFESRIDRHRQVVCVELVKEVIQQLGMPDGSEYCYSADHASHRQAPPKNDEFSQDDKNRLYRNVGKGKLGGVCSGLADYLNWDITLIRVLFLVFMLFWTLGIWFYIILWIAVPERHVGSKPFLNHLQKRLFRDMNNKKIAGVCSGLSHYLLIDVSIVRIIFAFLFFCAVGFVLYIILWLAVSIAWTPAEKCEMYNVPATAENLRKFGNY